MNNGKILNVKTGRMVNINGKIGRSILNNEKLVGENLPNIKGENLPEFLRRYIRNGPSPKVRKMISEYGNYYIKSIKVCRRPLEKLLRLIANALSKGEIEKHLNKYGYDNLYHLFTLVTIDIVDKGEHKEKTFLIDKQEVVNFKDVGPNYYEKNQECTDTNVTINSNIKINDLFKNGDEYFNKTNPSERGKFWLYDAFYNNCQIFVYSILKGNNVKFNEQFVMQDVNKVVKKTDLVSKLSNVLTDTAALADRVIHGKALRK